MHNKDPLKNLDYFVEWGGRKWETLLRLAISELQKDHHLDGADLLDVGTRYGKMASLFALMGAQVTGIDICEQHLNLAKEEARRWSVPDVNFIAYHGDLDIFPDENFDIIFTKSVLVLVPDLEGFLKKVSAKLRSKGKIVFLENGKGNVLLHMLRKVRHRKWKAYKDANYFTDKEVRLIRSIFEVDLVRRTNFPPIYLIVGRKKCE